MDEKPAKPLGEAERALLYVFAAIVGIPCLLIVLLPIILTIFLTPHDKNVSSAPRYSEIYQRTFTAQQEFSVKQWSDSGEYELEEWHSSSEFPKIAKGDKLKVKKIVMHVNPFAGNYLKVYVEIDDPLFSKINSKGIDAHHFLIDNLRSAYNEGLILFDPNYLRTGEGMTLHRAVQYGDEISVKNFVEGGANINQEDLDGKTPLHYAVDPAIIAFLLDNGAEIDHADRWGNTPLHQLLSVRHTYRENLHREAIALLAQRGAGLEQKDRDGNPPLILAANNRNFLIAEDLLKAGANPNTPGERGDTILLLAALDEQNDTAALALKLGADPNALTERSRMASLHFASRDNNINLAGLLLDAGALVDSADEKGKTSLYYAYKPEMARYLIDHGADLHHADNEGKTPLHRAVEYGNSDVVRLLLEMGADENRPDLNGETPLNIAHAENRSEIIRLLNKGK